MRRILSLEEYRLNEMEEGMPFEMDESLLDELVELVGSEEEIESAAAAAPGARAISVRKTSVAALHSSNST